MYIVQIPLILPPGERIHPSMGSIFHGALMDHIGDQAAARFHEQTMRPYSQSVGLGPDGNAYWRFGILTDDAYGVLASGLTGLHELYLKHKGYAVRLGESQCLRHETYALLMQKHLQQPVPKQVTLHFHHVTSFKQQGKYVMIPDQRLILQSLLLRFNQFSPVPLEDGIAEVLAYYVSLRDYALQSASFGVEGRSIKGFKGTITYTLQGEEMMRRTGALLFDYANFAGVGIKTALGMGFVTTTG